LRRLNPGQLYCSASTWHKLTFGFGIGSTKIRPIPRDPIFLDETMGSWARYKKIKWNGNGTFPKGNAGPVAQGK